MSRIISKYASASSLFWTSPAIRTGPGRLTHPPLSLREQE
jgi:hypothetical protein